MLDEIGLVVLKRNILKFFLHIVSVYHTGSASADSAYLITTYFYIKLFSALTFQILVIMLWRIFLMLQQKQKKNNNKTQFILSVFKRR